MMPSTNGHGSKRAILYARVSTEEQARSGYSLAQQMEALREHATREGYEVLEEVFDRGQSGASLERPGMDRVRDFVAAGGVSVVLAQDRDRIAREPAYHYLLRREFEEHGAKIRALNDRGDESPEGELTDGILDQLSKYERAKTAERTRRGRLRKVREGKILAVKRVKYGFRFNVTRDGYEANEETMHVVRRIFRMIGEEGATLWSVTTALDREGVKPPAPDESESGLWNTTFIRGVIKDDAYRPHSLEEIETVVAPEVFAKLDPSGSYGIWWFNKKRTTRRRVAENGPEGKVYRWKSKTQEKPREEWIGVPVPDSGIPRGVVDAARAAIRDNRATSNAGRRFWELSGGLLRCGGCGRHMASTSIVRKSKRYFYYRCTKRWQEKGEACSTRRVVPALKLERDVWQFVSSILQDPETLREDLDRMIDLEREALRGDPEREAKAWLDKLSEADRQRARAQDMVIEGLLDYDGLRAKLAGLDETRKMAERELETLKDKRERIAELEQDRDAMLLHLESTAPDALDALTPEEKQEFYRILRLRVVAGKDGVPEVSFASGEGLGVCEWKSQRRVSSGLTASTSRPATSRGP